MINLSNFPLSDSYSDPILSLSAIQVNLFVFNNPVKVIALKKSRGGGHDYTETPEQTITPGSVTFQNCVGLKFKNAIPGSIARVYVTIPEFDPQSPDPTAIGYTPTTTTVNAAGAVSTVTSVSLLTALLISNAPQSIPSSVLTRVLIDTLETQNNPSNDFTLTANHFVTNFSGAVLVSGFCAGGQAAGNRLITIQFNGSEIARGYTTGPLMNPTVSQIIPCAVGTILDLWHYQDSGVAQTLTGARFAIARLA